MRHQRWAIQAAAIVALGLSVVLGYLTLVYVASAEYALPAGRELALVAAVVVTATGSLIAARGWLPLAVALMRATRTRAGAPAGQPPEEPVVRATA